MYSLEQGFPTVTKFMQKFILKLEEKYIIQRYEVKNTQSEINFFSVNSFNYSYNFFTDKKKLFNTQ